MSRPASPNSRTRTIATKVTPSTYRAMDAKARTQHTTIGALLYDALMEWANYQLPPEPDEAITMEEI